MSFSSSSSTVATVIFLSLSAFGCAPQQVCPSVTTAAGPPGTHPERRVYRFDFGLSTTDGSGGPPVTSSFSVTLSEGDKGEVHVGKNVALSTASPGNSPAPPAPRQDVGLKVAAQFRMMGGEDPLVDTSLEMSAFEPPTSIRKVVAKSDAVAPAGKPVIVTMLDDDHKRYQLTVTSTRVR